jgi:fructose 1,6-bisphosphatase
VHTTVSVIKADVGSLAGHVKVPEELLKLCETSLSRALKKCVIKDFRVTSCGDDIELIMSHGRGVDWPFEPHLLHPEELEYTTLPQIIDKLKKRFETVE